MSETTLYAIINTTPQAPGNRSPLPIVQELTGPNHLSHQAGLAIFHEADYAEAQLEAMGETAAGNDHLEITEITVPTDSLLYAESNLTTREREEWDLE